MCLFLCANPKLHRWVAETVVRSERDALRLAGAAKSFPRSASANDNCAQLDEEVVRSRRIISLVRRSERPIRRVRISSFEAASLYAASYDRASFHERKNALDALADAWNRLLVLFGWRR
jgi:hypothetical protein